MEGVKMALLKFFLFILKYFLTFVLPWLILYWISCIFWCQKTKWEPIHKFLSWGISFVGIGFAVGLISSIYSIPGEIIRNPDEWLYFEYLAKTAKNWSMYGGFIFGTLAMIVQAVTTKKIEQN
ncbi:hypothetical protein ISS21_01040 [Patescibacteria group bacterium]|nr:hypothetical protein [Patescibacteria group bacterium]